MLRLNLIFNSCLERIKGKGAKRHGDVNEPTPNLSTQPLFQIPKALNSDITPFLFQAVKKIYESQRLDPIPKRNELLDAINYLAAAIIYMDEKDENMC